MLHKGLKIFYICQLLISLMVFTIGTELHAQNATIDSLSTALDNTTDDSTRVHTLNELAYAFYPVDPRKTIDYATISKEIAEDIDFRKGMARAVNLVGIGYWYVGEYDSSITFFRESYEIYGILLDKKGQSDVLNNMGNVYRIQGNYPKSIEYFQKSLQLDELRKDENGVAISYINIGLIHKTQKEYKEALVDYKRALKIFQKLDNHFGIGVAQGNIGEIMTIQENFVKARTHYRLSLSYYGMAGARCRSIFSKLGMGETFLEESNKDSAVYWLSDALNHARECENPFVIVECLLQLGNIAMGKGENDKALNHLTEAFDLSDKKKLADKKKNVAKALSQLYENLNTPDLALTYFKVYNDLDDSLYNQEKTKELARLEYIYENERKERERESKDIQITAELQNRKLIQQITILGLVILLVIAFFYYNLYVKKNEQNKKLEKTNEIVVEKNSQIVLKARELREANEKLSELSDFKEGLAHMLVHDMKNSLNIILGLSEGKMGNSKMKLISRAGRQMLNLVMNVLDVQKFEETKVPLKLKNHPVVDLVFEAKTQVELFLQMNNVRLVTDIKENNCIEADREIIVRVLVNLLTNAIKYSPPGSTVRLEVNTAESEPEMMNIAVHDKGEGISEEKLPYIFEKYWQHASVPVGKAASTGLGLTFCKLAVEAHGGNISVMSQAGLGSVFCIKLPVVLGESGCEKALAQLMEDNGIDTNTAIIETSELPIIRKYADQLRKLKVYQVSELQKILSELEDQNVDSRWKNDLRAAVLSGDETRYYELIKMPDAD